MYRNNTKDVHKYMIIILYIVYIVTCNKGKAASVKNCRASSVRRGTMAGTRGQEIITFIQ